MSRQLAGKTRTFISHIYPQRPLSTQFDIFFSSRHLRNGVQTCNGLSNTARIVLAVLIRMYRHTTPVTCVLTQTPPVLLEHPLCTGRISPRHYFCNLCPVSLSQTARPPGQSSLPHPTRAAGKRGCERGSVRPRWRSDVVCDAAPASGTRWPQLPGQLRSFHGRCSGAQGDISFLTSTSLADSLDALLS